MRVCVFLGNSKRNNFQIKLRSMSEARSLIAEHVLECYRRMHYQQSTFEMILSARLH